MADLHPPGRYDRMSDDVLTLTGQPPQSVQEFVRKNAARFTASAKAVWVSGDAVAPDGLCARRPSHGGELQEKTWQIWSLTKICAASLLPPRRLRDLEVHCSDSEGGLVATDLRYGRWDGEIRSEFAPQPGDIVALEHWCFSGFANTDSDYSSRSMASISSSS
jgi:hypothetical protein